MRKGLVAGLIAVGLMAALPAVTMAADPPASGGPPSSVSALCGRGETPAAIPIPSDDVIGGRAPSVFFGDFPFDVRGPLGIAPSDVFGRTGGCDFTQPPS